MKREIKFRGLTIDSKEWVYGDLVTDCTDAHSKRISFGIKTPNCYPIEVHSETIGQYTGLKYQNGVEVYDGDIVEHYDFEDGSLRLRIGWHQGIYNMVAYYDIGDNDYITMEEIEHEHSVIGNIHQNPELL